MMSSDLKPEQEIEVGQGSRTQLYLAVLSVNFLYICNGTFATWTSPTMAKLKDQFTANEIALVGSLFSLGAAFGPIIAAFTFDNLGRKVTLYIWGSCFIVSWIILASSINVYVLYVGRIIGGVGVGGSFSTGSLFIAEVADVKSRGSLGTLLSLSLSAGFMIEYCIGPWSSYHVLIIVSAIPAIIFIVTFFYFPESPYYLLIKNRKADAIESLRWYRGNIAPSAVETELSEMQKNVEESRANKAGFRALGRRGTLLALMIGIYLLILQQGDGQNALLTYTQTIFEMSNIEIPGSICAIISGATIVIGSCFTPFIVNRFSMKKTFIVATYLVAIAMGLLGLFFYLKSSGHDVSKLSFLPLLAFVMYNLFAGWGPAPIPWAMTAELLPTQVKGICTCICGVISSLAGFLVIEITGIMFDKVGHAAVFGGYFIFIALFTTIGIFIIPDTSGMSLPEVHEFLQSGKRPQRRRSYVHS
ncbi:hypothetical protein O3M35_012280 [Rhynocoris fuscipes]|uniref:Major facilitator superfamily (MFS) profile domain-containing protein n=1 Tax=Rhynocoris fuscipes TaxID=488301 RepID=A0AAW1CVS1_9HEMI